MILTAVALPVLLLGVKWGMDRNLLSWIELDRGEGVLGSGEKRCATEVALAVAKNWNPGLSLGQQKTELLKIADKVYNSQSFSEFENTQDAGLVYQAVPGLEVNKKYRTVGNSALGSLEIIHDDTKSMEGNSTEISFQKRSVQNVVASTFQHEDIEYKTLEGYANRYEIKKSNSGALWNPNYALWRLIDWGTASERHTGNFYEVDEEEAEEENYVLKYRDIFELPTISPLSSVGKKFSDGKYYPNESYFGPNESYSKFYLTIPSTENDLEFSYSPNKLFSGTTTIKAEKAISYRVRDVREEEEKIFLSIEEDQIKASADNDVAYAVPAQCNVDVVLAVPVNGAASNPDNYDTASETEGVPYNETLEVTETPERVKGTPIYQIGQACKELVKNFYHIRGVNFGLIPYSGKVSLSPGKAKDYTTAIPAFEDESTDAQVICNAALYSTKGQKAENLKQSAVKKVPVTNETLFTEDTPYIWGSLVNGFPIMSRQGELLNDNLRYGGNKVAAGELLSSDAPTTAAKKYRRMNLNPCYGGYSNLLAMKCERECPTYLPNPYYMIELTADLSKISEMCNALYPIYDPQNVSNFIFLPLEWADNFFQSWTNDPGCIASARDAEENEQILSRESKMKFGRKKAIILFANKPDWFEPGELTYLGFDNDASEIPMRESDKIDFSINYDDTTKKFLDGDFYNGTVAGTKKIIKFVSSSVIRKSEYYECSSGTARLTFPHKGTVRLKVSRGSETSDPSDINLVWKAVSNYYDASNSSVKVSFFGDISTVRALNDNKVWIGSGSGSGYLAYSTDGEHWYLMSGEQRGDNYSEYILGISYETNKGYVLGSWGAGGISYSSNGSPGSWIQKSISTSSSYKIMTTAFGNGKFLTGQWDGYISYSIDGKTWYSGTNSKGSLRIIGSNSIYSIAYGDKFVAVGRSGYTAYSTDGENWNLGTKASSSYLMNVAYGNGKYISSSGSDFIGISQDGQTWDFSKKISGLNVSRNHYICYGAGAWLIVEGNNNKVWASIDNGANWRELTNTLGSSIYSEADTRICYSAHLKKFFVGCESGKIYSADWPVGGKILPSTLSFKNVLEDSSEHEITEETEFFIEPSQISDTKDADGNYYIEFELKNIRLISAEITNMVLSSLSPKEFTHSNTEMIGSNGSSSNIFWTTKIVDCSDEIEKVSQSTDTEVRGVNNVMKYTPRRAIRSHSATVEIDDDTEIATSPDGVLKYEPITVNTEQEVVSTVSFENKGKAELSNKYFNYEPIYAQKDAIDTLMFLDGGATETSDDYLTYEPIFGLKDTAATISFENKGKAELSNEYFNYEPIYAQKDAISTLNFSDGGSIAASNDYLIYEPIFDLKDTASTVSFENAGRAELSNEYFTYEPIYAQKDAFDTLTLNGGATQTSDDYLIYEPVFGLKDTKSVIEFDNDGKTSFTNELFTYEPIITHGPTTETSKLTLNGGSSSTSNALLTYTPIFTSGKLTGMQIKSSKAGKLRIKVNISS